MSVSRHTAYNVLGAVIPIGLSLVTVPIYLRLVGADRYGVLTIAWLLLGYFGLFDLGLGRATSFRIAALREGSGQQRADTFWAAIAVNLGMGVIGGLVLWGAASYFFAHAFRVREQLRPEILASVPFLAASVPIATLTGVLTGALQGRERFLELNVVSVVSTVLFQIIPLGIALTMGPHLVLLLAGAVTARVAALAVLAHQCHVELAGGYHRRLVRDEVPILLRYGGWVTLTSIFGPVLFMVDRFAIGAVLSASAVTIYAVPFQVAQRVQILPGALTNALFPRMSGVDAGERSRMGENATMALAALISLPVMGGIFLMEPFLRLWVGPGLGAQSAPIGRILLIGFWANAFGLIPFVRIQASGRPDLVTKVLLLEIPPYLLGLYLGMTHLGLWGAALAFAGRLVVDFVLLTWAGGKNFKGWPVLALTLLLLSLAAYLSGTWSLKDLRWWVSAIVLGCGMLALSWYAAPEQVTSPVTAWTSRVWRQIARS